MDTHARMNSDARMHKDSDPIVNGALENSAQRVAKGYHGDPRPEDCVKSVPSRARVGGAAKRMLFVSYVSIVGSLAVLGSSGCDSDSEESPAAQAPPGEPPPAAQPPPAAVPPPAEPPPSSPTAAARADAVIATMTLDQKLQQIANLPVLNEQLQDEDPPCEFQWVGRHIEGIPELNIPTMRFANGGTGLRGGDCLPERTATAFPSNIAAAATFDPEINYAWGQVLGDEVRAWAHQGLLAPAFNTIRTPWGGRNHEYMSEDPFLTGTLATQQVLGIQSNGQTHAIIKHIVGNESEYQRERWTAASRIPSRAMHELYLLPFEMTIKDAKAAAVMCSYPNLNFHWSCENEALLQQTVRERWGFDGYVMSDRGAVHSTVPSIRAGTGIELDFEPRWYAPKLIKDAITAGEITEADIDALLRPRYTKSFEFGHFDEAYDAFLPVDLEAHSAVSRRAADAAVVLLKNDGLLPLNAANVHTIALIGADWFAGQATMPPRGLSRDEMTNVEAPATVTPQQGLENTLMKLGSSATVTYSDGDVIADAVAAAEQADIAIVMVGDNPRETWDKTTLSLPSINGTNQDLLVPRILAANRNTVVVLKTEGSVLMPWLPQARALVEAWYPGQNDGDVVADILFGVTNPSGKLPVTFGNTAHEAAYETEAQYPGIRENNGLGGGTDARRSNGNPQLVTMYNENLKLGYRWYEAQYVTPVFPFGHGLSYTTYTYSGLTLAATTTAEGEPALTVTYTVANTGAREGREATQVYLTLPQEADEPSKRLAGFKKISLQPSESQEVVVTIDCSASNHPFSYFLPADEADLEAWANGDWVTPSGQFTISVGTSSADTPLQSSIDLDLTTCTPPRTAGPTDDYTPGE